MDPKVKICEKDSDLHEIHFTEGLEVLNGWKSKYLWF